MHCICNLYIIKKIKGYNLFLLMIINKFKNYSDRKRLNHYCSNRFTNQAVKGNQFDIICTEI